MKRYTVQEFPFRGAFSSARRVYRQLKGTFCAKNRRGGIIVFPDDMMDIDTSFVKGRHHVPYQLSVSFTGVDGAVFSDTSLCLDVLDYNSGELMILAMKYAKMYGRPLLLKDFDDKKFYHLKYNLSNVTSKDFSTLIDEGTGSVFEPCA